MKIITSQKFIEAKRKGKKRDWEAEGYTEPYNAFAICNNSVGGKGEEDSDKREKWDRCVRHVRDQSHGKAKAATSYYPNKVKP